MTLDTSRSEIPQWNNILKTDHFIQLILVDSDLSRQIELFSTYIDVMTDVIDGGNLHYRNKLEKIFFGTFYINFFGVDNFLFTTFLTETPEYIDTLEKLRKINPPIYRFDIEKNHSAIRNIRFYNKCYEL